MCSAHYGTLGLRPDMAGDKISNGAADNATGCGILLELARVFGAAREHPGRSVIFAAVTAEEQGLVGAEYLGKHPPGPAGKNGLGLNYDEVKPAGGAGEGEGTGADGAACLSRGQ